MVRDGVRAETVEEIIECMKARMRLFIDGYHYPYDRWYVGVSDNPAERLLRHGIDPKVGPCMSLEAPTAEAACDAGRYFIETLGSDGNVQNGGKEARHVYAYKKSLHTKP